MEIEEYRPEPPRPLPPERKRPELSIVMMGTILVGAFLVTLAVLSRHDIADYIRQFTFRNPTSAIPRVMALPETASPNAVHPTVAAAALVPQTIERLLQCLSGKALSSEELGEVTQALKNEIGAPAPPSTPALNSGLDLQNVTPEQMAEFAGMLKRMNWPLGLRAQSAFQQGLANGTCRLVPSAQTPQP